MTFDSKVKVNILKNMFISLVKPTFLEDVSASQKKHTMRYWMQARIFAMPPLPLILRHHYNLINKFYSSMGIVYFTLYISKCYDIIQKSHLFLGDILNSCC